MRRLQLDDETGSKGRRGQGKITGDKKHPGTFTRNHDAALADSIIRTSWCSWKRPTIPLVVLQQPNAGELFRALRQWKILVVLNTGYNRKTAESLIAKSGWTIGTDLDGLVTATDVEHNRPSPDMIHLP